MDDESLSSLIIADTLFAVSSMNLDLNLDWMI